MKILQFYTSTAQRDAERVNSQWALLSPTWKFLPFQIQRAHLADTYVESVFMYDCDYNIVEISEGNPINFLDYFLSDEELINDWDNGSGGNGFNTFADDNLGNILTAITTDLSRDICNNVNQFSLATGESIVIDYDLTLNSGTLPRILLGDFLGAVYSIKTQTVAGGDVVILKATGNSSGDVWVNFSNEAGDNTSFSCVINSAKRTNLDLAEKTSYDFISYNGEPLNTLLSYGVYYLKVSDGNSEWFSEWFSVENIQPQLITSWPTESYTTFTTSGANITSAIDAGAASARTNAITARTGEKFIFNYDLTLNSGVAPTVTLLSGGSGIANIVTLTPGLGSAELTSTKSAADVRFFISTSGASNFSLLSVRGNRKAGEYVHLEFTNARDFNNEDKSIYYVGGWTQQAYLRSYLNLPSHETIEVGPEKNGEFVAEKLVSKYNQSLVTYESRAMYDALRLLPLHSTIKILDEVGIEHTPKTGNVEIGIDWNTFDTGSLRIAWNEAGTVWTNSSDNIT